MVEAFDIDPIPHPSLRPPPITVHPYKVAAVEFGGWIHNTYVHVVPSGHAGAKVTMHVRTLQELDGVVYHMQVQSIDSRCGVTSCVLEVSGNEVRICTWNCTGIPRASFR